MWIFLQQAENEHEANIIESILDSEGIPSTRKYREAGEYLKIYMGMTNFGIDIYIPQEMEEKAKGILENDFLESDEEEFEEVGEFQDEEEDEV